MFKFMFKFLYKTKPKSKKEICLPKLKNLAAFILYLVLILKFGINKGCEVFMQALKIFDK